MEKLVSNGFTRRTAVLVTLLTVLAAGIVLAVPGTALAACCGWEITTTYWNSTYTVVCGECITNIGCSGQTECWGTTTSYTTRSRVCCETCQM
ncbi:MAG TPA: hypothetical protein VF756_01550 [Thermoanaerobaculia bacterium]